MHKKMDYKNSLFDSEKKTRLTPPEVKKMSIPTLFSKLEQKETKCFQEFDRYANK